MSGFKPRERRFIQYGLGIVVLAVVASYLVIPAVRRWQIREIELQTSRAQLKTLSELSQHAGSLDSAASAAERVLDMNERRIIRARSATLASSELQSLLQGAADASALVVTRLDVVSPTDANTLEGQDYAGKSAGMTTIPATLAAYGDIFGLSEFLLKISNGPRQVRVEKMTVQQNSALRGAPDVLQFTVTLSAPAIVQ